MVIFLLNILILIFIPFITAGIIKKTKAFWAGRKGVSILQPIWDFLRLIKKTPIYSTTTSWVFRLTPAIIFAAAVFASFFVPLINGISIINIPLAFIIFAYILGLGKFFALLSALDTGSSFEGMGASREACFSTIIEPAFFIIMASVSVMCSDYTFTALKTVLEGNGIYGLLIAALTAAALFIMLLTEGCRVPVDDPATHLELTMIHEVMILDNSGADLALITYSSYLKIFMISALIANIVIPYNLGTLWFTLAFLAVIALIAIAVGTVESAVARFRMSHVFEFVFIMTLIALLILALTAYRLYGG